MADVGYAKAAWFEDSEGDLLGIDQVPFSGPRPLSASIAHYLYFAAAICFLILLRERFAATAERATHVPGDRGGAPGDRFSYAARFVSIGKPAARQAGSPPTSIQAS